MCREHLGEVRSIYPRIQELGAEVLAISFSPPDRLASFLKEFPLPFPLVADTERIAYRAFLLERTSVLGMLRLGAIGRFIKAIFRGTLPKLPAKNDDLFQLGGDFVVDAENRLRYAFSSREPTDRPSLETLVSELESAKIPI